MQGAPIAAGRGAWGAGDIVTNLVSTLARIDLLAGREADVWLDGCGTENRRISIGLEPGEGERERPPAKDRSTHVA